ncbi:hypothetical protein ACFWTE_20215 [Nocardiopsis sp. NPDC058631]|uniref:hypothetical protein n=1 Tax=Nocardiopsis sp. NPDC058631 TaxID=3346566 RepID=UPI003669ED0B
MSGTDHAREFAGASRRHFDDAELLRANNRLPNADYHYGFSVECALKSLLLRYLGATMDHKDKPILGSKSLSHLPGVWDRAALHAQGRSATRLVSAMGVANPFTGYSVAHRYRGNPLVDADVLAERRQAARGMLSLHQQALVVGGLR